MQNWYLCTERRHNTQHIDSQYNDILKNDTQRNDIHSNNTKHEQLSAYLSNVITLSVIFYCYAACCYAV
jgi:hypothetical protein